MAPTPDMFATHPDLVELAGRHQDATTKTRRYSPGHESQLRELAELTGWMDDDGLHELGALLSIATLRPWGYSPSELPGNPVATGPAVHDAITGLLHALFRILSLVPYSAPTGQAAGLDALQQAAAMLNQVRMEPRPWTIAELRELAADGQDLSDEDQARLDAANRGQ
ncbi:hypothetical protein CcI49_28370 [Frankia sp. CcI49]|uniref:hypothetical protein n=1 Tax=Frankia sp. CcI49 TaxID=1745382 RepID=UPI0009C7842C|nr:hypothetical protein [Frankia sp. CcI49]ONH55442.1 hypothetical protein CcI49_28370 [Frankia sp. CcI49]